MTRSREVLVVLAGCLVTLSARAAPVPPLRTPGPAEQLLTEVSMPPLQLFDPRTDKVVRPEMGKTTADSFPRKSPGNQRVRQAVENAHLLLWATCSAPPPRLLERPVLALRKELGLTAPLPTQVLAPKTPREEVGFKDRLLHTNKQIARVVARLEVALENLQACEEDSSTECPRWRANFRLTMAWVMLRLIVLEEQSLLIGLLRRELPERDPNKQRGWKMVASQKIRDVSSKKVYREVSKHLQGIERDFPDTVWARQAHQVATLGLSVEWVAME